MAFALWRILRAQKSSGTHRPYAIGLFLLLLRSMPRGLGCFFGHTVRCLA